VGRAAAHRGVRAEPAVLRKLARAQGHATLMRPFPHHLQLASSLV
jgi:hypothetical protein